MKQHAIEKKGFGDTQTAYLIDRASTFPMSILKLALIEPNAVSIPH